MPVNYTFVGPFPIYVKLLNMQKQNPILSFELAPNFEEIFAAPNAPLGIFVSSQKESISFAAIKFEQDLQATVLEEVILPLNLSHSLINQKCLICWSESNEQVAFVQDNQFKCILDFDKEAVFAHPLYLKTNTWSYIQYSSHHIPNHWFPYVARTQKNKALRNACLSSESALNKLLIYKEALKTEVIVPITHKEDQEHYIVSFKLKEHSIVCLFVDMLAASTHLPEQLHFKTLPFSQLCKHCIDFNINSLQLYTDQESAILISEADVNTLALGVSDQDDTTHLSEFNWVTSFFEDLAVENSDPEILKELEELFLLCPHIEAAYLLRPRFEESFLWICCISEKPEKALPSFFYDRFHQLKSIFPKLSLHSEYSILSSQDPLARDILQFNQKIYSKEKK